MAGRAGAAGLTAKVGHAGQDLASAYPGGEATASATAGPSTPLRTGSSTSLSRKEREQLRSGMTRLWSIEGRRSGSGVVGLWFDCLLEGAEDFDGFLYDRLGGLFEVVGDLDDAGGVWGEGGDVLR